MKIVVTGASGHVGANLCRKLLENGHTITALYRADTAALKGLKLELVQGDIADSHLLKGATKGADVVFHLAAKISISGDKDGSVFNTNTTGTQKVVEACLENSAQLVHFSSIHSLNPIPFDEPVDETRDWDIRAGCPAYNQTKVKAEKLVSEGCKEGLQAVILNPTGIIGPYDYKPSLMGQGLIKIFKPKIPAIVRGGFNWVDVRDVVDAAISAMEQNAVGERFILSGNWVSFMEMAKLAETITETRKIKLEIPVWAAKAGVPFALLAGKMRSKEPLFTDESITTLKEYRHVDCSKAKKVLNFRARSFEETLRDTYTWFLQNGYL